MAGADPAAAEAGEALLDWGQEHPDLTVHLTQAGDIGLTHVRPALLRIWPQGEVEVKVDTLRKIDAAWDDERIERLIQRLERVDGVVFTNTRLSWPRTPLAPLADAAKRQAFIDVIADAVRGLNLTP
jgi:hypothetical protein